MARPCFKVGVLQKEGEAIRKRSVDGRPGNEKVQGTPPLPVNTVDVGLDDFDVEVNKDLAEAIRALVKAAKTDRNGQRMVIGWRLYPNCDHKDWEEKEDKWIGKSHSCGCGCGCGS